MFLDSEGPWYMKWHYPMPWERIRNESIRSTLKVLSQKKSTLQEDPQEIYMHIEVEVKNKYGSRKHWVTWWKVHRFLTQMCHLESGIPFLLVLSSTQASMGSKTPSGSSCECVLQHAQTLTLVLLLTIVKEQTYFYNSSQNFWNSL